MSVYYMRDNHTFNKLSYDVEKAKKVIIKDFELGFTYGMLCTHDVDIKPIHGNGDIKTFLPEVAKWYELLNLPI